MIKSLLKGFRLTKPLIAAVEGPAIAGGTEILQGTDIRVAGESAKFGVSEARWALYPMGGSAVRLVRQIPYTVAADLLLTGRHILAPEAKELGLIGHVVPDGEALAKAHEIADLIAANGPLAVQAILKTMRDSEGKHEDDCWADDARVGAAVFASEDAKEGPRAFIEKRPAELPGSLTALVACPRGCPVSSGARRRVVVACRRRRDRRAVAQLPRRRRSGARRWRRSPRPAAGGSPRRSRCWSTGSPGRRSGSASGAARTTCSTASHDGRDLVSFDYEYKTQTSNGKQTTTTVHRFSVLGAVDGRRRMPPLSVDPENFLDRFVGRLTGNDIDLESEEFNRAFTVSCPDRKFASDVLHPQMMEFLLAAPAAGLAVRAGLDARDRRRRARPRQQIDATLAVMDGITDRVPEFVWLRLRGQG